MSPNVQNLRVIVRMCGIRLKFHLSTNLQPLHGDSFLFYIAEFCALLISGMSVVIGSIAHSQKLAVLLKAVPFHVKTQNFLSQSDLQGHLQHHGC